MESIIWGPSFGHWMRAWSKPLRAVIHAKNKEEEEEEKELLS